MIKTEKKILLKWKKIERSLYSIDFKKKNLRNCISFYLSIIKFSHKKLKYEASSYAKEWNSDIHKTDLAIRYKSKQQIYFNGKNPSSDVVLFTYLVFMFMFNSCFWMCMSDNKQFSSSIANTSIAIDHSSGVYVYHD